MANNNISNSSTPSVPTFVPRILMIATYTQQTQMPIIISTSSTIQTDTQTLHNISTQTKTLQTTRATQTSPPQNSRAVQTDHMVNDTLPLDFYQTALLLQMSQIKQLCQSTSLNSNRKKKIHKEDQSSDNWAPNKERKKVSFLERSTRLSKTFNQQHINDRNYTDTWDLWTTTWNCSKLLKHLLKLWLHIVRSINSPDISQSLGQTIYIS